MTISSTSGMRISGRSIPPVESSEHEMRSCIRSSADPERLVQESDRAALRRFELQRFRAVTADEDDAALGRDALRELDEFQPFEAIRSGDPNIGDDMRGMESLDDQLCRFDVVAGDDRAPFALQSNRQTFSDVDVVVEENDELRVGGGHRHVFTHQVTCIAAIPLPYIKKQLTHSCNTGSLRYDRRECRPWIA